MSPCPKCTQEVLQLEDGRRLNPKKSRLGRILPDGTQLGPDELRAGLTHGHLLHYCPPNTKPTTTKTSQDPLF